MRHNRDSDSRLRGGIAYRIGDAAAVLFNADGYATEALATPTNTTVCILTRNRSAYLHDLLLSIESDLPATVQRHVIVNNTSDDTVAMLERCFPAWRVDDVRASEYPSTSNGLHWFRTHRPDVLPASLQNGSTLLGYGPTSSIAWLRNRQLLTCPTRFLISFDDDMLVRSGWLNYLLACQNRFYAFAVINNFASYLLDSAIIRKAGWFDERFLRSHGYEDNDYLARINESRLRWVLGFNIDHDWRSAEKGNPRGSGTGSDLFIHRYAQREGGFSAKAIEESMVERSREEFSNRRWYESKWQHVTEDTGVCDRPPFRGYFLRRLVADEPEWYSHNREPNDIEEKNEGVSAGAKLTQNTPLAEIDPFDHPATSTMIDRYAFFSHWCKGKAVLDAGCGHGYGSALLYSLGAASVLGIDSDVAAIDSARQRYQRAGLDFADVNLLALPETFRKRFDTVVCVEVFEHLSQTDVDSLLTNLREALRRNGTLIVTTPRRKSPEWHWNGGTHLYEYSCSEFRSILRSKLEEFNLQFCGIREFQVPNSAQWFSLWCDALDDSATVMVAVARGKSESQVRALEMDGIKPMINAPVAMPHAMPKISVLIANRNTLSFLKLAVKSCREYLCRADHELIIYDDASNDGSVEWLQANANRYDLKVIGNPGPVRRGIVYVYDELVRAASQEVVLLAHSDMVFAFEMDVEMWRHFGPLTVATCTRIEPRLYRDEPYRILEDFGNDAGSFQEEAFLRFAEMRKDRDRTTCGVFAPIMMWRKDFLALGGHDKVFAPQSREDSDLFNRMQQMGLRFIQSWSAFCYHFSGRGSRKKDSVLIDSEEWKESNSRNERNFIRKWGTSVRHDEWLKPIVVRKRYITLIGLLGNEAEHIASWMSHLEPYVDEIVLVDDSSDGSAQIAAEYIRRETELSSLVSLEKLQIIRRSLENDFAASRNLGHSAATFDWVLHVDLDERLERQSLELLQDILGLLEANGKLVCGFPRLNTLEGVVVNDLPRSEWNSGRLMALASQPQPLARDIKNLDLQFRLLRRDAVWMRQVHEAPQIVIQPRSREESEKIVVYDGVWIRHDKSLRRQARQDLRYQQIAGKSGSQGDWDPADILKSLGENP